MPTTQYNIAAALFAAQVAFLLYGAGIRRPFGSLATVAYLPSWIRTARALTLVSDVIFWGLALFTWYVFLGKLSFTEFVVLIICASIVGNYLSHRITILPSFVLAVVLALVAAVLTVQNS